MPRRVLTAREQYDLWEPWREAASSPWTDADGRYQGPMRPKKYVPHRDAYSEDENGNCVSCGVHFSQPHVGPHEASKKVGAADNRHPDLLTSLQQLGVVHNSCGRCLPGYRTAAADFTGPQDTTFSGFDDPRGWTYHTAFEPSQIARQGASAYSRLAGLQDPHDGSTDYLNARRTPESVRAVAQNYDSLPMHDPAALKHFDAFRNDINAQHDFMTNRLGIKTQITDHDPYNDVHEMLDDVNNNHRLQVLGTHVTGGHPYLDDATNDKLRAVHDLFGHAATGRSFDRHGEQAAYLAHAQMFSPQARPALATETRGQNSSLILNGGFQPQKTALLHPQFWSGSGPMHLSRHRHAIPEHLDRRWKEKAMEEAERNNFEGLTMRDHPGDAPQHGYMVSIPGHEEKHPMDDLSGATLGDYGDRKRDVINSDPAHSMGGWHQAPDWYNDVSKNYPDLWHADKAAFQGDQQALYDIDRDRGIGTDEGGWMTGAPWITGQRRS